ncbi:MULTISPECIES: hypothetical protein [unclassified Mesorhizobium]|uniref:hypothetical protein n=1 Tax=unclassified Mesorhizobium TaxID=325217 RepID=UPI000FCABE91|nr:MULTISPECIES: hypothetical protein [unclassified Mesorhizobium]RUW00007.1 hypothetical protein EOA49_17330 [Mesorhizobium sp. M1A.F.Ca.IN.020.04.1.1]RUW16342.1 hypothetical protein EOA53_00915 [Mesorhizobium sp. M1A.F.Ca.IN.020.03.1.1]RWF75334.1 MAG: hypothetical protein EOQ34_02505 [Mesorhizobium sp.]RWG15787.1 MAG: hypothetical protein EOQ58_10255 [Mesorhizobium sp.]RWG31363.1 MAG: hypothetical protein EOQ61_13190 [Mesorhizobium sp.]
MANGTFTVPCPAGQWTKVADGANYSSALLQVTSIGGVLAAIADSQPAAGASNGVLLSQSFVPFPLAAGDQVWCQPVGAGEATVRGIGTSV